MRHDVKRQWFRNIRQRRNLTMAGVAELFGLTMNYISEIEQGRKNPSPELALRMSREFDFPMEWFFDDTAVYEAMIIEEALKK